MKLKLLVITVLTGLTLNSALGSVIAGKNGTLESFNNCLLESGKRTLEIASYKNGKITETSRINTSLASLEELALPAINGIGRRYSAWRPDQINYIVNDGRDNFETFSASGFQTIINQSSAALRLKGLIDHHCSKNFTEFKIIGEFKLNLRIGNNTFEDKLVIRRGKHPEIIVGTYSVPNTFESAVERLNYRDGTFSFIIRVQENEDDYEAIFEGTLSRTGRLVGKAYTLPARKLLGTFTGKRIR